jgi:hypothetical protein
MYVCSIDEELGYIISYDVKYQMVTSAEEDGDEE